jgi:pantothenate synthetase
MGQMILKVVGSTVGTVEFPKEISSLDTARTVQAYAYSYREKWTNEDGTLRQPSINEVLQAWWDGIIAGSVAHVLSVEKERAAEAAAAAVQPVSVT